MNIFKLIASWFNKAIKLFKEFINEALPVAKQIIVGQLSGFAEEVTKELNLENMTNEEKRKAAFERIKQYAINHGIHAKDSLINTIIELALQKIKEA